LGTVEALFSLTIIQLKMYLIPILLALALAPGAYLAHAIYLKDKYEPEPKRLLFAAFCAGCLSVVPVAILERLASVSLGFGPWRELGLTAAGIVAFLAVALVEEGAKFLMLRFYAYPKTDFNEPFDGIVYGSIISLGFATIENIFYVLKHGVGVGVLRMFTAVPGHYAYGVVLGYYMGRAKFEPRNKTALMLQGFCYAVLLHGAYDFFALQGSFPLLKLLTFVVLIVALRLALKEIKELEADSKWRFGDLPPVIVPPPERLETDS
jgi:RsiW-degrading membrane proteinase PrsW (M82 family)